MTKHIFITGGVVSSLGKGITSASLAMLLKNRGYRVAIQKFDPYLNVNAGIMSPFQHGEIFITDDGVETDLDLGHYERFTGVSCSKTSTYTSGRLYKAVLDREEAGGYNGNTVQLIPHITDEIKAAIRSASGPEVDILLTEIGGTAGDIESHTHLEAIRQFRHESGAGNVIFIHLTLVPYIKAAGELKTKPSQQSVAILRNIGIMPDVLVCRAEVPMDQEHRDKLALFCNVPKDMVIEELDVKNSIYEVPSELARQQLDIKVLSALQLPIHRLDLSKWDDIVDRIINPTRTCRVAIVGQNPAIRDAYKSVYEALIHAGIAARAKVETIPCDADEVASGKADLTKADAILIPDGYGPRGAAGMIAAVKFARENNIPFLGIGFGMHCMIAEAAAGAAASKTAATRLGAFPCKLAPGSVAAKTYGADEISERHRQHDEIDNAALAALRASGLTVSGTSPDGSLVEIMENTKHPFFVGCQFHPEFKSRPDAAAPLFCGLVNAALGGGK
ncbi:MAG: CTP synthase [Kiritimatiellaeota bacterium]|nr:CTP synthase [Kiritimatiellota bacterium]